MTNSIPPESSLSAPSAFLHIPSTVAYSATPSIIHLKRDLLLPISFHSESNESPSHRDGRSVASSNNGVLNTRFGDFPHGSIIGQPYGSQVRATNLGHSNRKRKRRSDDGDEEHNASGFLHVLAPTAELWTASLPHRTQVVYTPDSSYVLHKLGVRPGSVLIEAGAGSGSFTHAAVRAVYRGYPDGREGPGADGDVEVEKLRVEREGCRAGRRGRVWSFEFHQERVGKLREEIGRHGLDGLVEVVHRDVCKDGFLIKDSVVGDVSPEATAIFLDLPAPWLALPHLTRKARPTPSSDLTPPASDTIISSPTATITATIPLQEYLDSPSTTHATLSTTSDAGTITHHPDRNPTPDPTLPSALSQTETVRICTFSPCIEQVTRTVSVLRKLGWVEIEMHEIQHRRVEVRRSNRRGYEDGAGPRSVAEAVQRLKWVGEYRSTKKEKDAMQAELEREDDTERAWKGRRERKSASVGMAVTRVEPEVKSHTSYLVFAVLPREWSPQEEEEVAAYVKATTQGMVNAPVVGEGEKWKWTEGESTKVSKRQLKKLEKKARKAVEGVEGGEGEEGVEEVTEVKEEEEEEEEGSATSIKDDQTEGKEDEKMEIDE